MSSVSGGEIDGRRILILIQGQQSSRTLFRPRVQTCPRRELISRREKQTDKLRSGINHFPQ